MSRGGPVAGMHCLCIDNTGRERTVPLERGTLHGGKVVHGHNRFSPARAGNALDAGIAIRWNRLPAGRSPCFLFAGKESRYYRRMATTAIDTLRYARKLKDAGVPADQAEAMADAIGSELVDQLATKADLVATKDELEASVKLIRTELGGSIRLLQWMLGFTLAFVVAIAWRVFA